MKKTDTIEGYEEAEKNISGLFQSRMNRGITQKELAQLISVGTATLCYIEKRSRQPTISTYNKLAKFFGWKKITNSTPFKPKPNTDTEKTVLNPEPVKLPARVKFTFEEGHSYQISKIVYTENNRGGKNAKCANTLWSGDCVFRYEGKHGIHHIFREVRGNWTRTYTDAQLIGKRISEVE